MSSELVKAVKDLLFNLPACEHQDPYNYGCDCMTPALMMEESHDNHITYWCNIHAPALAYPVPYKDQLEKITEMIKSYEICNRKLSPKAREALTAKVDKIR